MEPGEIRTKAIEELRSLLEDEDLKEYVTEDDISRLESVFILFPVSKLNLLESIDNHADLERELTWFSTKFNECKGLSELDLKGCEGRVALDLRNDEKPPQWVGENLVKDDLDVICKSRKYLKLKRVADMTMDMQKALFRRESLIGYLFELEKLSNR